MKFQYPARIRADESGRYFVQFLDIEEAITEGETLGYLEKLGFSFKIKACEKFYRRHIVDIPRIKFFT